MTFVQKQPKDLSLGAPQQVAYGQVVVRAGGGQVSARKRLGGPTSLAPLCLKHSESCLAHLLVINNYLLMDKHCLQTGTGGMNFSHYFLFFSFFFFLATTFYLFFSIPCPLFAAEVESLYAHC